MPVNEKLGTQKCVETVWGKLLSEKEAYTYMIRHISAFSANIFQLMRILEPDYNTRTEAICEVAYSFNMMAASGTREEYVKGFRDEWNVPEFCARRPGSEELTEIPEMKSR